MSLAVHLLKSDDDDEELIARLVPLLDSSIRFTHGTDTPIHADFDFLVSGVPEQKHIEASERLSVLIIPWAGLPRATRTLMLDHPHVAVHNLHHNAQAVAEIALGLMLAAAKRLVPIDRAFRGHDWRPRHNPPDMPLLQGKTALILGYGAVGRCLAPLCRALGMKVLAIRRDRGEEPEGDVAVYGTDQLQSLLPQANILFVTVPMTPETEGMIGADELARLPDGAIVVNVARGAVIKEAALYGELKTGRISAGLDVWYHYPRTVEQRVGTQPSDYPFHELDSVVMTPHLSGHANEIEDMRAQALSDLLHAALSGSPLPNRVDVERGY